MIDALDFGSAVLGLSVKRILFATRKLYFFNPPLQKNDTNTFEEVVPCRPDDECPARVPFK